MGGGLPLGIIFIGLLVVVAIAGFFYVAPWVRERQTVADALNAPDTPTLDYHVPEEQDPAVVLAALGKAGYDATVDRTDTRLVRVACPDGPDRERDRVRAAIESASTTALDTGAPMDAGRIRFTDER
jgi:hypothetical protein